MFKSSTFRGTAEAILFEKSLSYTSTGTPIFLKAGKLRYQATKSRAQGLETSIRTDKSGSKSRAEEESFDAFILVEPTPLAKKMKLGMRIDLFERPYVISQIDTIHNAMDAVLDHFAVGLTTWQ